MNGQRYTTEDKIRLLREADRGERTIQAICQEANSSEVTFHRWKKQFGHLEVNEAWRLQELERENTELKKMLAEELLKNRVLSYVCEKSCEPGQSPGVCAGSGERASVFATAGVPVSEAGAFDVPLSRATANPRGRTVEEAAAGTLG